MKSTKRNTNSMSCRKFIEEIRYLVVKNLKNFKPTYSIWNTEISTKVGVKSNAFGVFSKNNQI